MMEKCRPPYMVDGFYFNHYSLIADLCISGFLPVLVGKHLDLYLKKTITLARGAAITPFEVTADWNRYRGMRSKTHARQWVRLRFNKLSIFR